MLSYMGFCRVFNSPNHQYCLGEKGAHLYHTAFDFRHLCKPVIRPGKVRNLYNIPFQRATGFIYNFPTIVVLNIYIYILYIGVI